MTAGLSQEALDLLRELHAVEAKAISAIAHLARIDEDDEVRDALNELAAANLVEVGGAALVVDTTERLTVLTTAGARAGARARDTYGVSRAA